MRALTLAAVIFVVSVSSSFAQDNPLAYLNPSLPAATRAHDLVSRMTLDEKASQLEDWAVAIPRLGVPDYQTWNEALHGVARAGYPREHPRYLCHRSVPVRFVIADGIVAMEGNGPLNGIPRPLGRIVLADDPVAADSTCARLMGFEPNRIAHIHEGSRFLGNASPVLIDQVGENLQAPASPFQVVPEFRLLYAL